MAALSKAFVKLGYSFFDGDCVMVRWLDDEEYQVKNMEVVKLISEAYGKYWLSEKPPGELGGFFGYTSD
jgi:hypothetical protein